MKWKNSLKTFLMSCSLLGMSCFASAEGIDNSALSQSEFRSHQHTYGLVYRLPDDVTDVLNVKVRQTLQEELVRLKLHAET